MIEKRIEDTELEIAQNDQLAEMWADAPLTREEKRAIAQDAADHASYLKRHPEPKPPKVRVW